MSDPLDDVMSKVVSKLNEKKAKEAKGGSGNKVKEKLFNNKYYRSVHIDFAGEEKQATQTRENVKKAEAKKKEDEEAAQKPAEYKKMLQGMGFDVK